MQRPLRAVRAGQCAERRHRAFGPAGGLSAGVLPGIISGVLHHQGTHGVYTAGSGDRPAGVPLCGAGLPPE